MRHDLDRRQFLRHVGLSLAGLSVSGCSEAAKTAARRSVGGRPNIIYILADDLGYGDLGCYGQAKIKTPNIDRMAAEGMRFTQHYSGSTVCAPSRCCLMTGLHTGHAYIRGNREIQPEGQEPIRADTVTVGKLLKRAGYITGMVGKWGLGSPGSEGVPNRQGFDYFFGHLCQREAHFYYPPHLWRNEEKIVLEGNDRKKQTGRYSHDLMTDEVLAFIRRNKARPFFLYVPYTIPHAELAVPEDSLSQYEGKFPEKPFPGNHYGAQPRPHTVFAAMVSRLDRDVGKILALLRELRIDDRTLVMFTSDNGPHREGGADPGFFQSSGPLRGIKRDLYEGGIRVPLVARWPGKIGPHTVSHHVSAFWDFLPTACELAGVKSPEGIDGISMMPTLLGGPAKQQKHKFLYWEFHERGSKQAVRMGRWKAVRFGTGGKLELYDLDNDIGEANDVAAEQPEIVAKIEAYLVEARTESKFWNLSESARR
ncbi:MAG: arylsulfatase [Phycisphaerales bacterium]|nr:MAG: arylsulfatase [Phycisphaerales bacterium]